MSTIISQQVWEVYREIRKSRTFKTPLKGDFEEYPPELNLKCIFNHPENKVENHLTVARYIPLPQSSDCGFVLFPSKEAAEDYHMNYDRAVQYTIENCSRATKDVYRLISFIKRKVRGHSEVLPLLGHFTTKVRGPRTVGLGKFGLEFRCDGCLISDNEPKYDLIKDQNEYERRYGEYCRKRDGVLKLVTNEGIRLVFGSVRDGGITERFKQMIPELAEFGPIQTNFSVNYGPEDDLHGNRLILTLDFKLSP